MKKVLALGILYGFFCGSTDALADDLRNITHYGKWAEEADGADTSVVDEASVANYSLANGNDIPSNDPTVPKNTVATNVMDTAPVQDGYVALPARATPEMDDGPFPGAKTRATADDKDWWKHPEIELGILAGGSGSYIPVDEKLTRTLYAPEHYKFHVSGEGVSTGMNVYAGYRRGDTTFGAGVTAYVDTHTLKNYDAKKDLNSGSEAKSMTFLNRSYTLEFAARAGHYFKDLHLYGKLGILCSAFQYKLRNSGTDSRNNLTAWGGSAGIGLQKPFSLPTIGDSKIGLEYNYQIYQTVTPVIKYGNNKDTSKLRPRYHTGFLTIVKPF